MSPSNADLGRAIRRLRHATIDDLAGDAGIHPTYLSAIERGIRNPSWVILCKLVDALDIPMSRLVAEAETEAEIDARMREVRQSVWLDSLKQDPPTDLAPGEVLQALHEGRAERDAQIRRAISDDD